MNLFFIDGCMSVFLFPLSFVRLLNDSSLDVPIYALLRRLDFLFFSVFWGKKLRHKWVPLVVLELVLLVTVEPT